MPLKDVLGFIAMCATLGQVIVGMSAQIRKLAVQRSTIGLSFVAILTAGFGFTAWTVWSYVRPINLYVAIPNTLGMILSVVLVVQILRLGRGG